MIQGIRDSASVPVLSDFASSDGSPLIVNGTTGDLYFVINEIVKRISNTAALVATKFTSINVTAGTLAAGNITGAQFVTLMSTNALPGAQTTRTATQMVADVANVLTNDTYVLRIINTGAGTLTLTAGGGVTLTGTMTVLVNTWRDFVVTFTSATTMTVQTVGTGTYS